MFIANGLSLAAADSLDVKLVTVCEVLAEPSAYGGKKVAILGKFEGGNLIDGCCALVEDRCKRSVVTEATKLSGGITTGYAWDSRIDLAKGTPITSELKFGGPDFDEKLRVAGIWTNLNCSDWPVQRPDGTVFLRKRRQQWAVAYGTINTRRMLHGPKGTPGTLQFEWGNGFGHLGAAPVQLVYSTLRLIGSLCRGTSLGGCRSGNTGEVPDRTARRVAVPPPQSPVTPFFVH
jgi:hypothetical protein